MAASNRRLGGGSPPGGAQQIAFGNAGGTAYTSSADFKFDDTTDTLTIKDFSIEGNANVVALAAAERSLSIGCAAGTASMHLVTNNTNRHELDFQGFLKTGRRFQLKKGADVASAGTLTLGGDGNVFHVTGTTTINHGTTTDWQAGSVVLLKFEASVQVTHNAGSPPADTVPFLLAGGANFSATAGDTLLLYYDGGAWREVARTVI